ncbi:MAG: succinate dehydrogenase, cytochrome b556 subunit, partial [Pseudomonadota bacterium]
MSQSTNRPRPLSPHLQVYRLPYNAVMSISGRAAGIILSFSFVVLCLLVSASIWFPSLYMPLIEFLSHPFIYYILLLWAFVIFFYLGNGIRHFLWDQLVGINERMGIITGNIVLLISALLTLALWGATSGTVTKADSIQ